MVYRLKKTHFQTKCKTTVICDVCNSCKQSSAVNLDFQIFLILNAHEQLKIFKKKMKFTSVQTLVIL